MKKVLILILLTTSINAQVDFDCFIGEESGDVNYYERQNSGSGSTSFSLVTGNSNPLNSVDVFQSSVEFVDIDGDGDQDCFIGGHDGAIYYYKNTGNSGSATFTAQTSGNNPFNGVDVGVKASPAFVDIDGDGDQDCFIGEDDGTINYYKNTGNSTSPTFTAQTGGNNPFNGVDDGSKPQPAFVDIDGDGDNILDTVDGDLTLKPTPFSLKNNKATYLG